MTSCNKEQHIPKQIDELDSMVDQTSISNRSIGGIDWLIDFQTHLRNQRDGLVSMEDYSNDELIFGIEKLLNIRHANYQEGVNFNINSTRLSVDPGYSDHYIYEMIRSILLDDKVIIDLEENLKLFYFDITLNDTSSGGLDIVTSTVVKNNSVCGKNQYNVNHSCSSVVDCSEEVFESGEAYFIGLGGIGNYGESDILPILPQMCSEECGSVEACSVTSQFAMEEIQAHINASNCEPDCPNGMIWDGTYSDITTYNGTVKWDTGGSMGEPDMFIDCLDDPYELSPLWFTACDCVGASMLNCMYEQLCEARQSFNFPFQIDIPEGYLLIHTDLGVNYNDDGGAADQFHTDLWVSNTFAKPNCVRNIIQTYESALDMVLK